MEDNILYDFEDLAVSLLEKAEGLEGTSFEMKEGLERVIEMLEDYIDVLEENGFFIGAESEDD